MGNFMVGAAGAGNSFAAQAAPIQSQDFKGGLDKSAGQFNQTFDAQSALANQMAQMTNGYGPNPAQIMLNQATNRNIQQNAGMLASQRTLSPALAQRLAAQNAANVGQQAVGQGALMGAQQQVSAQQNLAGLLGQQQQGALGMNSTMQNALGAYNNAQVGMTNGMNTVNAGVAGQNAAGAQKAVGGLLGGAASSLFANGGMVPENFGFGGAVDMPDAIRNAQFAQPSFDIGAYMTGDDGKDKNSMGGGINKMTQGLMGGQPQAPTTVGQAAPWEMGGGMAGGAMDAGAVAAPAAGGAAEGAGGMAGLAAMFANKGGQVPGCYADGGAVQGIASLIPLALAALNKGGEAAGTVPGQAQVSGDSLKNDKVPAMLSPREIVLPRSITTQPNAPELAAEFVRKEIAKHHSSHGGNYADGGGVPMGLDPQAQMPDVGAVPNQVIPGQPAPPAEDPFTSTRAWDAHVNSSNGIMDNVRPYLGPGWQRNEGDMKGSMWKDTSRSGAWSGPSEAPSQQSNDSADDGPATMPQMQSPQGAASQGGGGSGGYGVDAYMKPYEDIYQRAGDQQAQQNYKTNQQLFNLDQDRQSALESYKSDDIKPERVFENMGTGERIKTTLGLLLGGLGSGFTGGPNAALEMLNKKIDRDIDAQKTNLGKKHNLLGVLHQQYGDTAMADGMARVMQRDYLNTELQKQSMSTKDPVARLRAQAMMSGLAMQNEQQMMQLKMYKQMGQGGQGGQGPEAYLQMLRMTNPAMAKEVESRMVPGVGIAQIPIAEEPRKEMIARKNLADSLGDLRSWSQKHTGSMNPAVMAEGKAKAAQVQDAYRQANNQGVFKESEAGFVKGVIPSNPTAFLNSFRNDPKYKSAQEENFRHLNSLYQGYGLRPSAGQPQQPQQQAAQIKSFKPMKAN